MRWKLHSVGRKTNKREYGVSDHECHRKTEIEQESHTALVKAARLSNFVREFPSEQVTGEYGKMRVGDMQNTMTFYIRDLNI